MWYVIEFTDDKEVAVVPDNWLNGTKCALWPPFKNSERIVKAIKAREDPGPNWAAYPMRELYHSGKLIFVHMYM